MKNTQVNGTIMNIMGDTGACFEKKVATQSKKAKQNLKEVKIGQSKIKKERQQKKQKLKLISQKKEMGGLEKIQEQ